MLDIKRTGSVTPATYWIHTATWQLPLRFCVSTTSLGQIGCWLLDAITDRPAELGQTAIATASISIYCVCMATLYHSPH
jgi:hypothetical protein